VRTPLATVYRNRKKHDSLRLILRMNESSTKITPQRCAIRTLAVNGKAYVASFSNVLNVYGLLAADFGLNVTPTAQFVAPCASTTYTVSTLSQGGFTGMVSFNVSGLAAGTTPLL
jgi:hypothetical protein